MPNADENPVSPVGVTTGEKRIQMLPDHLVDQIAAGEVVERPASVVKELVENAVDAGARRIRVEIREGGANWIAVTDDGHGMSSEDARRALQRHATSKICCADDLSKIDTFGFRGEALPAIASVSRFRLRTVAQGESEGIELRLEGGRILEEKAAGGPVGTRIEVADLFASIPARRKFLKRASTEWGHVSDWLARAALALPEVHFEVYRDDRPAMVWPSTQSDLDRIAAVLSEEEAAAQVAVRGGLDGAEIRGFCSRPDFHRRTAAGIYLFVNGRPVRDRLLRHALQQEYRDLLPRGRFPSAVLFLEVPPGAVDVNVHPAKWEVRFADPQQIHRLVSHSVRAALSSRSWLGSGQVEVPAEGAEAGGFYRPGFGMGGAARGAQLGSDGRESDWALLRDQTDSGGSERRSALEDQLSLEHPGFERKAPLGEGADRIRFREMKLLGQLLATYLVLETRDALILVDQHAAHERVLYEDLRARWFEGRIERQPLLLTVSVELEPSAMAALLEAPEVVEKLGFEIEAFGEDAVVVRAIPSLLEGRDPGALVRSLADELCAAGDLGVALKLDSRVLDSVDAIFASLACHAARRKGDLLSPREQEELLGSLDRIPWAPTCPHGRPVAVPLELPEIERRFSRR